MKMINNTDSNNCVATHLFVFVYSYPVDHSFAKVLIFLKV
jgi:hypothetical protein